MWEWVLTLRQAAFLKTLIFHGVGQFLLFFFRQSSIDCLDVGVCSSGFWEGWVGVRGWSIWCQCFSWPSGRSWSMVVCSVSGLVAHEAQSFLHVIGLFLGHQSVDLHCIGVDWWDISGNILVLEAKSLFLRIGSFFQSIGDCLLSSPLIIKFRGCGVPAYDHCWRVLEVENFVKEGSVYSLHEPFYKRSVLCDSAVVCVDLESFDEFISCPTGHRLCFHFGDCITWFVWGGEGCDEGVLEYHPIPRLRLFLCLSPVGLFPWSCCFFFHEQKSEYDLPLVYIVDVGVHCQIHLEFNQELLQFLFFSCEESRCVHLDFFVWDCSSGGSWFLCHFQWQWFELD